MCAIYKELIIEKITTGFTKLNMQIFYNKKMR